MFVSIATIFVTSLVFLIVLLGIKGTRNYFLRYKCKEIAMLFLIFIFIVIQLIPFEVKSQYLTAAWQTFLYAVLLLSMVFLVLLFKEYKNKPDLIEIIMVLGVLQVSVAMMIASSEHYYWNIRLAANMIYLTIPTAAFYFLTHPKEEKKANAPKTVSELSETETSQSQGEE